MSTGGSGRATKRRGGRQLKVPQNYLISAIRKQLITEHLRAIPSVSHIIWSNLSQQVEAETGKQLSKQSIYLFATRHIAELLGVKDVDPQTDTDKSSEAEAPSYSNGNSPSECSASRENFEILISAEEWQSVAPELIQGGKQGRWRMRNGWTTLCSRRIWDTLHRPCTLSFRYHNVHPKGKVYFRGLAYCKQCMCTVVLQLGNEPPPSTLVTMNCSFTNYIAERHISSTVKRPLQGSEREAVTTEMALTNESASRWRKRKATESMRFMDPEPSHLYSLNVLRKAKSQRRQHERLHESPIFALSILKNRPSFKNTIKNIGFDKFHVFYWSPLQSNLYRICSQNALSSLCLDATGSLVHKLNLPSGAKSGHIFLYQGVAVFKDTDLSFPVVQMLSEDHHANFIAYWLNEWVISGIPAPKSVVCDMSKALLSASVVAFAKVPDLNSYIAQSWAALTGSGSAPLCYIRIDIAHLMKIFAGWPELRGKLRKIREFYLRSLGLLVQCKSLKAAEDILKALFTTALCETEGISELTGNSVVCETRKIWLKNKISGIAVEESLLAGGDSGSDGLVAALDGITPCSAETTVNCFREWASKLCESCVLEIEACGEGNRDNVCLLPEIAERIKVTCSWFPLWTAIVTHSYNITDATASSAAVESYFSNLKTNLFKNELPLRIDDFVSRHLDFIDGSVKLACCKSGGTFNISSGCASQSTPHESPSGSFSDSCPSLQLSDCPVCSAGHLPTEGGAHKCIIASCCRPVHAIEPCSFAMDEEHVEDRICRGCYLKCTWPRESTDLQCVENWRGQATCNPRKRRSYLQPNPNLRSADFTHSRGPTELKIMKNGSGMKSVKVGSAYVQPASTCAFDTLVHSMEAAYCDSDAYAEFVRSLENQSRVMKLVHQLGSGTLNATAYSLRAAILKDYFKAAEGLHEVNFVDCNISFNGIVQKVLWDVPSALERKTCTSPFCPNRHQEISCPVIEVSSDAAVSSEQLLKEISSFNQNTECNLILHPEMAVPGEYYRFDRTVSSNRLCKGIVEKTRELLDHIVIELCGLHDDIGVRSSAYAGWSYECEQLKKLRDFPTTLSTGGTVWSLRGVIEFQAPVGERTGHYVAISRRCDDSWEELDDLREKPVRVRSEKIVNAKALLYTV